jgi:hypothetical protein
MRMIHPLPRRPRPPPRARNKVLLRRNIGGERTRGGGRERERDNDTHASLALPTTTFTIVIFMEKHKRDV